MQSAAEAYIYTFDHPMFLALNFDGGRAMDWLMTVVSGTVMWIPLYAVVFAIIWQRKGWKVCISFVVCLLVAVGLADMLCGIFKHSGLLKHLWESFPPRPRPMFEPALRGLVHVVSYAHGPYGTVSSHAATVAAMALMSALEIRRRWFSTVIILATLLICYSRIYLACHYPVDIALGLVTGVAAGAAMYAIFKKTVEQIEKYAQK